MTHLQGAERAQYVQDMFDKLSTRYNLLNSLMTMGQDRRWRRFVVQQAALTRGARLLDLATGTGDIAFEAIKQVEDVSVVGGDFSLGMMLVGQTMPLGDQVGWCGADALNLPFPDNRFEAVTAGYLLRNVIDIPRSISELLRVLKPGGRVVILDTSPPPPNLLRPFIEIHLRYVIPTLGRILSPNPEAYQYLPASTQTFKTPEELVTLLEAGGFDQVAFKTFMFNTMAVHWGVKP